MTTSQYRPTVPPNYLYLPCKRLLRGLRRLKNSPVVFQVAHEAPDEQQRPDQTDTKTDRQHDHRDP